MARRRSESLLVTVYQIGALRRRPDDLIVEEPMTIQLDGNVVSTTMRTPGNDYELAVGFCFSDGLLGGATVRGVRYCADGAASESQFNVVTVETGGKAPMPTPRLGTTTSSCGMCGNDSIDALCDRLDSCRRRRRSTSMCSRAMPTAGARRPGPVLHHRCGACRCGVHAERRGVDHARGRRSAQRRRQGGRTDAAGRATAGNGARPVRQRSGQLRARAEGVGSRLRHVDRGQRPHGAGGADRPTSRPDARRIRARRAPQRLCAGADAARSLGA